MVKFEIIVQHLFLDHYSFFFKEDQLILCTELFKSLYSKICKNVVKINILPLDLDRKCILMIKIWLSNDLGKFDKNSRLPDFSWEIANLEEILTLILISNYKYFGRSLCFLSSFEKNCWINQNLNHDVIIFIFSKSYDNFVLFLLFTFMSFITPFFM